MTKAIARKKNLSGTQRIGVVVLGMHRSGTSALARVLSLLGCDLPQTLMAPHPSNEAGHWESLPIARLNDEILASAGSKWWDWLAFNPGWQASPKAAEFKDKALAALEEEFGQSRLFVLKDPRICRFAPFWLDVLETAGVRPAIIMPVRNPLEVAESLAKRDGLDPALGHLLWLRHVLEAEAGARGLHRFHSSYESLLSGWPRLISSTQEALGVSWPRLSPLVGEEIGAFLTERLRHHRESPKSVSDNPLLSAWLRETFAIFSRWAEEGEAKEDYAALDRIRAELDAAAPAFSRLISAGQQSAQKAKALDASLKETQGKLTEVEAAATAQQQRAEKLTQDLQAASDRVQDQQAKLETLATEHSALVEAKAAADRQLGETRAALTSSQAAVADKDREIAEAAERLAGARSELADMQAEVQSRRAALEETRGQLSHTQSALAQRSAEADEVAAQLREKEAEFASALDRSRMEKEEAERRLAAELEAERARLAERFDEITALSKLLHEKEVEVAAAQDRSRADKEAAERRLADAERAGHLAEELEAERARLSARFDEIATLTRMLRDKEGEVSTALERARAETQAVERRAEAAENARRAEAERADKLARELEAERAQLASRAGEIASLGKALRDKEAEAGRAHEKAARTEREMTAQVQKLRSEKRAVEGRLTERFSEIAVMTRLLGEKESEARLSEEQTAWLREVSAVLMNGTGEGLKGRLAALMPAPIQLAKQKKRLKRKGIFDSAAYLAAYPDVAEAGLDPLWHYINYGMGEGRQLHSTPMSGGIKNDHETG